jgi:hypothetical protein
MIEHTMLHNLLQHKRIMGDYDVFRRCPQENPGGVEGGSRAIFGRAGAPAFAWASAVAEAMADKPARQAWMPAGIGVPHRKIFIMADLVRFGAIWC